MQNKKENIAKIIYEEDVLNNLDKKDNFSLRDYIKLVQLKRTGFLV